MAALAQANFQRRHPMEDLMNEFAAELEANLTTGRPQESD
jgi:hypothetical protein